MSSDINDAVGGCETIEALGKVWKIAHVGPEVRDNYSGYCKWRARRELASQRNTKTGDTAFAGAISIGRAAALRGAGGDQD